MAVAGYRFDGERFRAEARKRGFMTEVQIADAAKVSLRALRHTVLGRERPSAAVMLWMAEVGIDTRLVWVHREEAACPHYC